MMNFFSAHKKSILKLLEPYAENDFQKLPEGLSKRKEAIEIRNAQDQRIFSTDTFEGISERISLPQNAKNRFISFETDQGEPVRILLSPIANGRFYLLQFSWLGDIKHTQTFRSRVRKEKDPSLSSLYLQYRTLKGEHI